MSLQQYFPLASTQGKPSGGLKISSPNIFRYSPTAGATVTTKTTTITATYGTGPYTYSWDSDPDITVNSPSASTTSFTASGSGAASDFSAIFTCTVTDSLSVVMFITCNVEIQIGGLPK